MLFRSLWISVNPGINSSGEALAKVMDIKALRGLTKSTSQVLFTGNAKNVAIFSSAMTSHVIRDVSLTASYRDKSSPNHVNILYNENQDLLFRIQLNDLFAIRFPKRRWAVYQNKLLLITWNNGFLMVNEMKGCSIVLTRCHSHSKLSNRFTCLLVSCLCLY